MSEVKNCFYFNYNSASDRNEILYIDFNGVKANPYSLVPEASEEDIENFYKWMLKKVKEAK